MADIAMCRDTECPVRGKCYRYLAIPKERQSYGDYRHKSRLGCLYLWPAAASKRTRRVEAADLVNRGEAIEERA